jgi:HEAT repeat protein
MQQTTRTSTLLKIGFAVIVLAATALVLVALWPTAEPSYQGQLLSRWLEQYQSNISHLPLSPRAEEAARQAEEAIRRIGTNALPTLIRLVRVRDSSLKLMVMKWSAKQSLIKLDFTPASVRWSQAEWGYRILGQAARTQVPELNQILANGNPPGVRKCVASALGNIGPEAKSAAPALLIAAKDQNAQVRNSAFWALWHVNADPEIAVPGLIKGLDDPDDLARENAAIALGRYGPLATNAVPALVRTMAINRAAHDALRQIDPEAARAARPQ